MDKLEHLKAHLTGKVVILGIGNPLQSDDAVGSLLARSLKDKLPHTVYDVGANPENYLGKVIKDKPDNIILIDAVEFEARPGEVRVFESSDLQTLNFFSTHDASLSLAINYLKNNLGVDIIILAIQPKRVVFGEGLSAEVAAALKNLEAWFLQNETAKKELKMKKIICLAVFIPVLFFTLSGCVPLIIGAGVGAVGGYAVSRDTVQGETDKPREELWNSAITVGRIRGVIVKEDSLKGNLELKVGASRVWISLITITPATTRLKVSARKHHFPDFNLAQDIFIKIMQEIK